MSYFKKKSSEEYWEKRLNKDFSLAGVGSFGAGLEYNTWLYKARLYVLKRLLKEKDIDYQGGSVLDVGVGTGFYINFWEKLGVNNITGIDITAKSVATLKKKHPNYQFVKADISSNVLPLNKKFDIITAFDILFHIVQEKDFEQAIKNIKAFSHKDSIILITDCFVKVYKPMPGYQNYRTLKHYRRVLNKYGMQIEIIKPIFYFMVSPIDIERINNPMMSFLIKQLWQTSMKVINHSKKLGKLGKIINYLLGLGVYCLDRLVLISNHTGPSTKLVLIRVKSNQDD